LSADTEKLYILFIDNPYRLLCSHHFYIFTENYLHSLKGTAAQTKHVLFDSWFSPPSAILSVKGLGFDVVCRLKNHDNFRYLCQGQEMCLNQIYRNSKKRRGREPVTNFL
jgi:hypothetical protein